MSDCLKLPLRVSRTIIDEIALVDADREVIAVKCLDVTPEDSERFRRIVACVNACAGISTKTLELGQLLRNPVGRRLHNLEHQCDQLLAALKEAQQSLDAISNLAGRDDYMSEMFEVRSYANARALVAALAIADCT